MTDLRLCLLSLFRSSIKESFEVIVVDNASFDGSDQLISRKFPSVKYIQSPVNLGFAGANNLGVEHSSGELLLFLNPDTEVERSSIEKMLNSIKSNVLAGIIGSKLLNSDRTIQTSCVQAFPTIINQILDFDLLRCLFPRWKLWGNTVLFKESSLCREVEAVSGACLLIRRDVFEKINFFSRDYFMYGEDLDLCWKVKKAGYKVLHCGASVVVHHGGKSSSRQEHSGFSEIMMRQSVYQFLKISHGNHYCHIYRVSMAIIALLRIVVLTLAGIFPESVGIKHHVIPARQKWSRIFLWSIGRRQLLLKTIY